MARFKGASVWNRGACGALLSDPYVADRWSFPVFLKSLRLFQVVAKIDDTLALLNLVSGPFRFCGNGSACGCAPRGGVGAAAPRAGGAPQPGVPGPPPSSSPGLHDDHHLPALHSEYWARGLRTPGGPPCLARAVPLGRGGSCLAGGAPGVHACACVCACRGSPGLAHSPDSDGQGLRAQAAHLSIGAPGLLGTWGRLSLPGSQRPMELMLRETPPPPGPHRPSRDPGVVSFGCSFP